MNWRFWLVLLVFGGLLALGVRYFVLQRQRGGDFHQCPHCKSYYHGDVTYCPHCGGLVTRWSNRR